MNLLENLLSERQIHYTGNESGQKQSYNEEKIYRQVDIIYDFHKRMKDIDGIYVLALPNTIGKKLQRLKVQEKRNYRYYQNVKQNGAGDLFDVILIKYCEDIFKRANDILQEIDNGEFYRNIILRSMKNNEIIIGDSAIENLYYDQCLCVNSIKKMALDISEWDVINLITKSRKKNVKFDENRVVQDYIRMESLDSDSLKFINLVLDYPLDFMKLCERKREKRKEYSLEYYTKRLNNYIKRRNFK